MERFISIVICTKNRLDYLKKCIDSILNNNYSNYELVIVNDASNDGTKEYLKKFKSFNVINNEKSRGIAFARNLGVKNCKGELIAFTDDDCLVDKNWLKNINKAFQKDIDCVMGTVINKKTKEIENLCWGTTQNLIFRRKLFDKINFDNFMKTSSDTDIIWRLINYNYKYIYCKDIKVLNIIGPEGLSTSKIYRKRRYYYNYYLALKQSILLRLKNKNIIIFLLKEPYYLIRDFFNVELRARIKTVIDYMRIK